MSYETSKQLILEQLKNYDEDHKKYEWYKSPDNLLDVDSAKLLDAKGIKTFAPFKEFKNLKSVEFGTTDCTMTIDTLEGIEENSGIESLTFMCKTKIKNNIDAISRMASLKRLGLYNVVSPVSENLLSSISSLEAVSLSKENYQLIKVLPEGLTRISLNFDPIDKLPEWNVVESVKEISIGGNTCKLEDLNSFRCFPGVADVKISSPKMLKDISYTSKLSKLKSLEINFADVEDFSPLKNHDSLEVLKVRGTKFERLTDIYPNNKLRILYAEKTKLKSIAGIRESLPNLELLWIWETKVKDLEPLRGMTSLKGLDITMHKVADWSFLSTLQGLELLDLCKTSFSDPEILMTLPKLKYLRLTGSGVDTAAEAYKNLEAMLEGRGGKIVPRINFGVIENPHLYK